MINDISTALDSTQHKQCGGDRTTTHVGLSMPCGTSIVQGNMRRRLADALNINRCVAMSVQQENRVLCDKAALWDVHVVMQYLMSTKSLLKNFGVDQVYHAQQARRKT